MEIEKLYKKITLSVLHITVAYTCGLQVINAQQDSQYTQYMYNTQTINPAYAGSRGYSLGITGLYRNQWVGIDGAPEVLNFSASTLLKGKRVGLGLSFTEDAIGPTLESSIVTDYSYNVQLGQRVKLNFGLKAGINLLDVNYRLLRIYHPDDPQQQYNIKNRTSPIIGAGLFLHDVDKWYVGLSVPNLLKTRHYEDTSISRASERAHLYVVGGYVFNLSDNTKFKPAVLGKLVKGAPLSLDISANFLFHDKFTLGASYRLDAAFSALAGFQISDKLFMGYAYDKSIQGLANYNSGSHEIFLRFEIGNRNKLSKKYRTPRFF